MEALSARFFTEVPVIITTLSPIGSFYLDLRYGSAEPSELFLDASAANELLKF
jgi:hypothetical protein